MKRGSELTRGSLIVAKASTRDVTGGDSEKLDDDVSISSENENL